MTVLVIKLGALGDIVQATGPFAAIRRHHEGERVSLLTTRPYAAFLEKSPWFDAVRVDLRAPWWKLGQVLELRRWLRAGGFDRVYDLQTSSRSSTYLKLFARGRRPEWSGIAPGASHPDADPERNRLHTVERQRGQLVAAGIADVPPPDLSWVAADIDRFGLPDRFALMVPGGSAHRPAKRWSADGYAEVGRRLLAQGIVPVLLGAGAERELVADLAGRMPGAVDLSGRTGFEDLVGLGRRAAVAVGNDTGPMHLVAVAGAPSLVLFSHESDPALCAPRGPAVSILRRPDLASLQADEVMPMLDSIRR